MPTITIDFEDDSWRSHISGDWIVTDDGAQPAYDGSYALRTPPMDETGTKYSYLDLSGLIPKTQGGIVSLYFRKSTYGAHNIFYLDGDVTGGYGNEVDWQKETLPGYKVNSDIIELRYFKNIAVKEGEDAVFVDHIEIELVSTDIKALPPVSTLLVNDYGGIPNPGAVMLSGMLSVESTITRRISHVADLMFGGGAANTANPGGVLPIPERRGVIAGTVLDIQAQPVSRRVRVHERATGRIVRETWSDADGKYRFTDLDPRRAFYVMAFDHTLQQNAVVSDNVHSEVEDAP